MIINSISDAFLVVISIVVTAFMWPVLALAVFIVFVAVLCDIFCLKWSNVNDHFVSIVMDTPLELQMAEQLIKDGKK